MTEEKLTISLFDRRPITVTKENWPVIASKTGWEGEHESQAFRKWRMTVRQHEDGRTIVYGVYDTSWQSENNRRGGELLDVNADIPSAIKRVGERLEFDEIFIQGCIADLPAEEL